MTTGYKRVPAVDKCFAILKLLANSDSPLGISAIARRLALSKSTVFNLIHTLDDLNIVERLPGGNYQFGLDLYLLANASGRRSALIQTVHPYLEKINRETKLSAFLGIRSGLDAVIVDKVDSAFDIKISSDIGMRLPLLAGAGGKALLCQLPDDKIDRLLERRKLKKFTRRTCTDKARFKKDVLGVRSEGIAFDDEEYIDGIVALAVPFKTLQADLQAAIWAVGLKQQALNGKLAKIRKLLLKTAEKLSIRFSLSDVFDNGCPNPTVEEISG